MPMNIREAAMRRKEPCVYILTNKHHTVLYTGVTSDLSRRMAEHFSASGGVFTRRYKANKLVFAEFFPTMIQAIMAEKRIKAGSRAKKIALIEAANPEWLDLMDTSGREETPATGEDSEDRPTNN